MNDASDYYHHLGISVFRFNSPSLEIGEFVRAVAVIEDLEASLDMHFANPIYEEMAIATRSENVMLVENELNVYGFAGKFVVENND